MSTRSNFKLRSFDRFFSTKSVPARVRLQTLESRLAPAQVTTLADSGPGSLREALEKDGSATFKLPGPSYVIHLDSALTYAGDNMTIIGESQMGYAGKPIVQIDLSKSGGLYAGNGGSITGLILTGAGGFAIGAGEGTVVANNYIGVDASGSVAVPNGGGVFCVNGNVTITGNVISGNTSHAIQSNTVNTTSGVVLIENNIIGLDADGTTKISNGSGITLFEADGNIIRGNVIAGNSGHAIEVYGTEEGGNVIQGNSIGTTKNGFGLIGNGGGGIVVIGPNNTIGGPATVDRNVIAGLTFSCVAVFGDNNTIQNNFLGTDFIGAKSLDTASLCYGLKIDGNDNTVTMNTISGNQNGAIVNGDFNNISGNLIGTDSTGSYAVPNRGIGLDVQGERNIIGGNSPALRNIISGNGSTGLYLHDDPIGLNKVQGNFIGTDKAGKAAIGNGGGVSIQNTPRNTIGGSGAGEGNLISGNNFNGVSLGGVDVPADSANIFAGNIIGLNVDGTGPLGNTGAGLVLIAVKNHTITGNIISANDGDGILLGFTPDFGGNVIQNNFIGTNAAGTGKFGNLGNGVAIINSNGNQVIDNSIANNGASLGLHGNGVKIFGFKGQGNQIRRNSIHDNSGRGIDLNNDGVTINDANGDNPMGKDDNRANKLQDYPTLVKRPQGKADIGEHTWQLDSTPNKSFTIDFYSNPSLDRKQYGEGEVHVGSMPVPTNDKGRATFTFNHTGHNYVTATATDEDGNTSEFSLVDTDADGLADAWELAKGIDLDEDGAPLTPNEQILLGANPDHKDLFVELDAMEGFAPNPAALNLVDSDFDREAGFGWAPDDLVHNPDGKRGINLHIKLDEVHLEPNEFDTINGYWEDFDLIKNGLVGSNGIDGHFGLQDQRDDTAHWPGIRTALQLTHRYGLFAISFIAEDELGNIITGASGVGEIGGNDFMVTLGQENGATGKFEPWGGLTDEDVAGTFMHELGHTLGLRHGGDDNTHNKPNYRSVMNYMWQMPDGDNRPKKHLTLGNYADHWRPDYSRFKLDTRDESNLNENKGINSGIVYAFPYYNAAGQETLGMSNQKVNWDGIGDATNGSVSVDINGDGFINGDDGMTVLTGHEDWSGLLYSFVESKDFEDGSHLEFDVNEKPKFAATAPKVLRVTINDGSNQRSRVTSVTLDFDQVVNLPTNPADAFLLIQQPGGTPIAMSAAVSKYDSVTRVILTFGGPNTEFGSLEDGRYTLTVFGTEVQGFAGSLDGDDNGTAGGDYVLACAPAGLPGDPFVPPTNIFRIFGDADGNGYIDLLDFGAFRTAYGTMSSIFSFDGDGPVDLADFGQFRGRYGMEV